MTYKSDYLDGVMGSCIYIARTLGRIRCVCTVTIVPEGQIVKIVPKGEILESDGGQGGEGSREVCV